jgi:putative transposase
LPTAALFRKHGLSATTSYKLKTKYGGMDLSEAKRLFIVGMSRANCLVVALVLGNVALNGSPPFFAECIRRTYAAVLSLRAPFGNSFRRVLGRRCPVARQWMACKP